MIVSDLILIHRDGKKALPLFFNEWGQAPTVFEWSTCLRQVRLFHRQSGILIPSDIAPEEIFVGAAAYRHLVEIVCGLKSPLFGETEVFGQFKAAIKAFEHPQPYFEKRLKRLFDTVLEDVKAVRAKFLIDRGSNSYGSLLRRELKGDETLHFLGAGSLVKDILPWVMKQPVRVCVYARNLEKAKNELSRFVGLNLLPLREKPSASLPAGGVLIVAAPMTSDEILAWTVEMGMKPRKVVDLRGEHVSDPLHGFESVLDLHELFQRLDQDRARQAELRREVSLKINALTEDRERHIEVRPFGWEDLNAASFAFVRSFAG